MSELQNAIQRRVLPYFGSKVQVSINSVTNEAAQPVANSTYKTSQYFGLKFTLKSGQSFTFPLEPIISISGKNVVAKRNVAKGKERGTIKERFSTDDWEINISGYLEANGEYPTDLIKQLKLFLEAPESIKVECKPLLDLDIHYIVIEDYSLPHTTGEHRQSFDIKAVSDKDLPLFIKV